MKIDFLRAARCAPAFLLVLAGVAPVSAQEQTGHADGVHDEQVHIPAGEFISGDGVSSTTDDYWIDKYEVTIGEYQKFVEWIEENAADQHAFNHPKQPRSLGHVPPDWSKYYGRAREGKPAHGVPINLNSPAITVTWWDAYAYAKWKGRELPTELEWEKAARGLKGLQFPWGEEADPKKANTNADYQPRDPSALGKIDGWNFWGDVDAQIRDESPFGVIGMAGNVSEWVLDFPDGKNPVLKGGNFAGSLQPMSARNVDHRADDAQEYIGFRTVTHTDPAPRR